MRIRKLYIGIIISGIFAVSALQAQPPGMMKMMGMGQKQGAEAEKLHNLGDAPLIYTLTNGMEIILIENHASPVIASTVVVNVGSRHESIEMSGASHFLEHLLFNGTETRTQKQLYDEMDFIGGYNNANTTHDHTNYMILVESSNFEKGLEIQADMLFHSTLPEEKFAKEKGIVTEEIGQGEDSESYRIEHFFDSVIFKGSPYERPILGSRQSVRDMTREQVWDYYKTHYVPNNMTALIMGDFQTLDMIEMVERVFGQEPPRTLPEPKFLIFGTPIRDPHTWESFYSTQGEASSHKIRFSYWAPPRLYPEYPAYMVLTDLLQDYLQKDLTSIPDLGISGVSVSYFADVDFALLNIDLTQDPALDFYPAIDELRAAIDGFRECQLEQKKVDAIITSVLSEDAFNAERPHFYGMMKSADIAQGGPYFMLDYPDFLAGVTIEDLNELQSAFGMEAPVVAVYEAVNTKADDEIAAGAEKITVRRELANGLNIIVQQDEDNPIFAAHFLFKHRSAYEIELGGRQGMVDFLHHLLADGPADMGEEHFADELDRLGARVKFYDMSYIPFDDYYTTPEFSYVRLEVMDDNYSPALKLVSRCILNPNYDTDAIESAREQMTGLSKKSQGSVSKKGRKLFRSLLYGDSYLAADVVGNSDDISAITGEELQEFGSKYFSPQNLILTVVTSRDAELILDEIEGIFTDWESGSPLPEVSIPAPLQAAKRAEETGGKEQSYLAMGYVFDLDDPEDRAPLTIMNSIISDRMQFQLREREGLAYSLGSSVGFHGSWGSWSAGIGTGSQNLARAEDGILEEVIKAAKGNFSEEEVAKARNAYSGRMAMRSLTRANRAYLMGLGELRGEGVDRHFRWLDDIRAVTSDDVARVAKRYLKSDRMTTAIVR